MHLIIPVEVLINFCLHFGPARSNDSVVVIPIDGINTPTQISNGVSYDNLNGCQTIVYQVYAIVNGTNRTSAVSATAPATCGDVCSLSSNICSAAHVAVEMCHCLKHLLLVDT